MTECARGIVIASALAMLVGACAPIQQSGPSVDALDGLVQSIRITEP